MDEFLVIESTSETITLVHEEVVILETAQQGPPGPAGAPGSAVALAYIAATPVSGHMALTLNAADEAIYADAATPTHYAVVGVSTGAASAGAQVTALNSGSIEHSGWAFTVGQPVFLGLGGALTQSLPVGAVFSKVLGVAATPTRITLDFQPAIFL